MIAAVALAQGLVFLSLKSRGSLPWGNRDRDYRLRSHWSKLPPVRSATRAQRKEQSQQLLGRCTKDGNSNTASLYKESETKMLLSVFVGLTTDLAFLQKNFLKVKSLNWQMYLSCADSLFPLRKCSQESIKVILDSQQN